MQVLFRVRDLAGQLIQAEFTISHDGVLYENDHIVKTPRIVELWTGLTDRNGVKIFEGDTVIYRDMEFKVEMIKGCWGISTWTSVFDIAGDCEVLKC